MATEEKDKEQVKTETVAPAWEWETPYGMVRLSTDLVRRYFCKNATEPEIMHFMAVCKYHRLNPYLREAYIIKYQDGEPAQIVMGKWAHARKAEEHPQYDGDEGGIIIQTPEGKIERREGTFFLEPEKLVGGWAMVHRRDRQHVILREVRLSDWMRPGPYWKSSPAHMIAKVAMSQARHEAFPGEYTDLIDEDEAKAGPIPIAEPEAIAVPKSNAEVAQSPAAPSSSAETGAPNEAAAPSAGDIPSEEEQEAIKSRERSEGEAQKPRQTVRVDRGKVWDKLKEYSRKQEIAIHEALKQLSGKEVSGLAGLEDAEVAALGKKLGV